jgi:urocanate hydratase
VVEAQYRDNLRWIREAHKHHLVVGSQARILYSDRVGRTRLALAFNCAVKDGTLQVGNTGHMVQVFVELWEVA